MLNGKNMRFVFSVLMCNVFCRYIENSRKNVLIEYSSSVISNVWFSFGVCSVVGLSSGVLLWWLSWCL